MIKKYINAAKYLLTIPFLIAMFSMFPVTVFADGFWLIDYDKDYEKVEEGVKIYLHKIIDGTPVEFTFNIINKSEPQNEETYYDDNPSKNAKLFELMEDRMKT